MSEFPIQKFIDLITFDQSINKLEQNKRELEAALVDREKLVTILDRENATNKDSVDLKKKEVDAKELEMKDLDAQEKARQEKLESVSNEKEYHAIKHEIDSLKQKQHNLEPELLAAWNNYETAQRVHEAKKEEISIKINELKDLIADTKSKLVKVEEELEHKVNTRSSKEIGVPEEWLEKYAAMRRQVSNPVVPVLNGSCSSCFYLISPHDMNRLRKRELIQCQDCFRFLYLEEVKKDDEATETV